MQFKNRPRLRPRKVVTVIADASFDEVRRVAGWAGYIVHGDEAMPVSGVVRSEVRDSVHAELAALGNVICFAIESFGLSRGDEIVAVSDNEHALNILARRSLVRADRTEDRNIRDFVEGLLLERGVRLSPVHVKGHQSPKKVDPVVLLQRWCDFAAKAAVVQHRAHSALAELVAA